MTVIELIEKLASMPTQAEVLINIGDRYAEIDDVKLSFSQREEERKTFVIVNVFK